MARDACAILLSFAALLSHCVAQAGTWFLFDITFYGNSLFQPTVLHEVFKAADGAPVDGPTIQTNICMQMALLALIGLPGYYTSVWLMDIVGARRIQLQGFFFMAIAFGALGIWQTQLDDVCCRAPTPHPAPPALAGHRASD